ncbi:hypothetical protein HanRHA438_Chr17g0837361 [Helianthus annuus]|nr:hypothetical protein HanPSC8_Chr17g0793711 [Helianthus annuus]KAJ0828453.1 hypothetical protein HanRHA438_Chr17g0837361 [Helianthus annuus]
MAYRLRYKGYLSHRETIRIKSHDNRHLVEYLVERVRLGDPYPSAATTLTDIFDTISSSPGSSKWRKIVHLIALAAT